MLFIKKRSLAVEHCPYSLRSPYNPGDCVDVITFTVLCDYLYNIFMYANSFKGGDLLPATPQLIYSTKYFVLYDLFLKRPEI